MGCRRVVFMLIFFVFFSALQIWVCFFSMMSSNLILWKICNFLCEFWRKTALEKCLKIIWLNQIYLPKTWNIKNYIMFLFWGIKKVIWKNLPLVELFHIPWKYFRIMSRTMVKGWTRLGSLNFQVRVLDWRLTDITHKNITLM